MLATMAAGWSAAETRDLISVWGHVNFQNELDGVTRNRTIFVSIAKEMSELGHEKTWKQCRTKVKDLTQRYRKVSIHSV